MNFFRTNDKIQISLNTYTSSI